MLCEEAAQISTTFATDMTIQLQCWIKAMLAAATAPLIDLNIWRQNPLMASAPPRPALAPRAGSFAHNQRRADELQSHCAPGLTSGMSALLPGRAPRHVNALIKVKTLARASGETAPLPTIPGPQRWRAA